METRIDGLERQRQIYTDGSGGFRPRLPLDHAGLERAASMRMSEEAFTYIAGGAGRETTMEANRSSFDRWSIVPRMLRDVSARNTDLTLLGRSVSTPLFLCPVGVLDLARPQGELLVARAAKALGIPVVFSNQASAPMEDCAAVMGDTPRWFQLYWGKSRELVESLVSRAEACGCSAIVVTLDTTLLGWRVRDLELAYLPFLQGKGIAQYVSDPVFQRMLDEPAEEEPRPPLNLARIRTFLELSRNYPGNFWDNLKSKRPLAAVRKFTRIYSNPSLTWEDLSFLRERTKLPIVLKGILHPDDALKALDCGMDAVYVSNHGGRQVDGAIGAAQALPLVAEAVAGRAPILYDSGIRGGADIFKALALGATAVGVGRPYVYGLALGGEAGVREVLTNLLADFDLTMGLSGCASLDEICAECLVADSGLGNA